MKVLVVEDDRGLANGISFSLVRDGYEVCSGGSLKQAYRLLKEQEPDAVLLDLNLPDGDGMEFCRRIREESSVPILMLTARDMETDEVQGLLSGADDYLTKPFSLAVLKARLDTVLRRSKASRERDREESRPDLCCGEIRLVPGPMKVYLKGEEISCSTTEFRLLYYLMKNRGQVLLKEQILEYVWDSAGSFVDENTLQVAIRRLRRKIGDDPADPRYIRTVRGMGYIFASP